MEKPLWGARQWEAVDKKGDLLHICECWGPWGEDRCVGAEVKECKRALRDSGNSSTYELAPEQIPGLLTG